MGELYLPVLSHFQNKNPWAASLGRLCFRITPAEETLTAELWEGPWCYECSRVEETRAFPLEDAGVEDLKAWLLEKEAELNARPPRGLDENLARRVD